MSETLEAPVGVDRQFAVQGVGPGQNLFPGHTPFGEAQILHEYQFGRGEAVVDFGEGQLVTWVADPGLGIGILGCRSALGKVGVVVLGVDQSGPAPGGEGQGLQVDRLVGVAMGVLGPHHDGCRGPVGHSGAVEDAESPGHRGRRRWFPWRPRGGTGRGDCGPRCNGFWPRWWPVRRSSVLHRRRTWLRRPGPPWRTWPRRSRCAPCRRPGDCWH